MLESVDFTSIFTHVFDDLTVVLPIALLVLATIWGTRLAITYFKSIIDGKDPFNSNPTLDLSNPNLDSYEFYLDDLEDSGYFKKDFAEIEADKEWLVENDKEWKQLVARWEKAKDGYI